MEPFKFISALLLLIALVLFLFYLTGGFVTFAPANPDRYSKVSSFKRRVTHADQRMSPDQPSCDLVQVVWSQPVQRSKYSLGGGAVVVIRLPGLSWLMLRNAVLDEPSLPV